MRCVHHGECGRLVRAVSIGERGRDSSEPAEEKWRQGRDCAARSAVCLAKLHATRRAGRAVRCSGRLFEQRAGARFARDRLLGFVCRRCLRSGSRVAEFCGERGLCFSDTCKIEAGRSQSPKETEGASGEGPCPANCRQLCAAPGQPRLKQQTSRGQTQLPRTCRGWNPLLKVTEKLVLRIRVCLQAYRKSLQSCRQVLEDVSVV